jgi:hypothetical protein
MPIVDVNFISPEYFQTLGIELRAGQSFSLRDGQNEPEAPKVAIINETSARRLSSDSDCVPSLNDFSVLSVTSVAIFEGGGGLSK